MLRAEIDEKNESIDKILEENKNISLEYRQILKSFNENQNQMASFVEKLNTQQN